MTQKRDLTTGSPAKKLFALTLPMVLGMSSIVVFNIVDTFFVAQLGTKSLAAMSFTFPIVTLIGSIALGLGTAVASLVSQAIGRRDSCAVRRLTTDSLILSLGIVALFVALGLSTIEPLFRALGAGPAILPLIKEYMTIWYIGVIFVVVPMVGNHAIRACGDTRYPAIIMVVSGGVNIILDPLLIFGLAGLPRLEMRGAALATLIARAFALVFSFSILHYRERMLDFSRIQFKRFLASCGKILYIGLPAAAGNVLLPLSMAVVTRLAAGFGPAAVAAYGAGTRVGYFVFIVLMALGAALVPFVGQNWGAQRFERVRQAQRGSTRFSFWWGLAWALVFLFSAQSIGRLFSQEAPVVSNIVIYLWLVPLSYGSYGICRLVAATLNAVNRPWSAAAINLIRVFILYIPLAWLGSRLWGLSGLFLGVALANIAGGVISLIWIRRFYSQQAILQPAR